MQSKTLKYPFSLLISLLLLLSCTKTRLPEVDKAVSDANSSKNASRPLSPLAPCLTSFYRYWSGTWTDHFYTVTPGSYNTYALEKIECSVYTCQQGVSVPLYRYWNSSRQDHYYTTVQGNYSGWTYEQIECYVLPKTFNPVGTLAVPLYEYWNGNIFDHFYTVTAGNYAGYVNQGIACYVYP